MEKYEETNIRSRIRAYNELIEFKNTLMPLVAEHCRQEGIKILKSGILAAKNRKVIDALIKETLSKFPERTDLRAYTVCSRFSAYLEFSISYSTKRDYLYKETWEYIKHSFILIRDMEYTPQQLYNVDSVVEDFKRLPSLRSERDSLNSEIRRIEFLTIGR